jgi:RNA polymerase sigma factor (sigma-70 family)
LHERSNGVTNDRALEAHWTSFHDRYSRTIRAFAFSCGATEEDIADCVQEVWSELLARLPTFRLDPCRGKFDTWLFQIVRGKTVDLRRARKRRPTLDPTALNNVEDNHTSPARTLENSELLRVAWRRIRSTLTDCNFQILCLRLIDERSVAEVAESLGLSDQQVWYRYHRARREVEAIGAAFSQ